MPVDRKVGKVQFSTMLEPSVTTVARDVDVVVSANTESIFLGSLVAQELGLPLAYVRLRPKMHGMHKQVEGIINPGAKALLVVDDLSASKSVVESVDIVARHGSRVTCCLSRLPDAEGIAAAYLQEHGVRNVSSSNLPALESIGGCGRQSSEKQNCFHDLLTALSGTGLARGSEPRPSGQVTQEQVAGALLDVGAVVINREEPFRYTSGLLSPIYTDCRLLISHPQQWNTVIEAFVAAIASKVEPEGVDILAGTATSGIPHASLVADRLSLPMVYVTFEELAGQQQGRTEGKLVPGNRVVMIEDHVTTGKSVLSSAKVLRDSGARVSQCFAIFTYGTPVAQSNFEQDKIDLVPLCDLETLLTVAMQTGRIGMHERAAVLSWLDDPKAWTMKEEVRLAGMNAIAGR